MAFITIISVAVSLAMDAFAVSIVIGAGYKRLHVKHALRMAAFFGLFQAIMPLIGSLAALSVRGYIENYAHWIVFGLLASVGSKMIYESFKFAANEKRIDPTNIIVLLSLSIATSIDALAVGITLSFITDFVVIAVIIIGLITFALSYLGVVIGKKFGHFCENKIEAVGGLVLWVLGIKILFEHLLF